MHPIVVHFAGGHAFFSGAALVIVALLVRRSCQRKSVQRLSSVCVLIGLLLTGLAATPLPLAFWITVPVATTIAVSPQAKHWPSLIPIVVGCWAIAALVEIPYQLANPLSEGIDLSTTPIVIFADSVTAGLGEGEAITWPQLLQERHALSVVDLSHVGETASSALRRARKNAISDQAIIILEIGGNDILGHGDLDKFRQDLNALLSHVCSDTRTVFLFELPLPPFQNAWGRVQRQLAGKHGVMLIPRHRFASVFAGPTATIDSIHLSQQGHERMLTIVEHLLRL